MSEQDDYTRDPVRPPAERWTAESPFVGAVAEEQAPIHPWYQGYTPFVEGRKLEEMYGPKAEWEAHLTALEAESPPPSAFDQRPTARRLRRRIWDVSVFPKECQKQLKSTSVAVVGSGLAGLMAARKLAQHGVKVTVFEARDQVGGRVLSNRKFSNGRITEEGAELIGSFHTTWLTLAQEYGLACISRMDKDLYAREGLDVKLTLDKPLSMDEINKLDKDMKTRVLEPIVREASKIRDPSEPWMDPLDWADKMSVADALAKLGVKRDERLWKAIEFLLVNNEVAPLDEMNFLSLLCKVKGGQGERFGTNEINLMGYWEELEIFRCADGCQKLATEMAREIQTTKYGAKLHLNRAVTSIDIRTKMVELVSKKVTILRDGKLAFGRPLPPEHFDYVVLTIPPSVWPDVKITADGKDAHPKDEIGLMGMGPAVKFFSDVKERFWIKEKAAPYGGSLTLGQVWEGTDNQTRVDDKQGIVLSVFAGPIFATRRVPTQDEFKKGLGQLYRGYSHDLNKTLFRDWPNEPFIKTGYAAPRKGEIFTIGKRLSEPFRDRLFFAGEHTQIDFGGFMEGALRSGERAAKMLMLQSCGLLKKPAPASSEPPVITASAASAGNEPGTEVVALANEAVAAAQGPRPSGDLLGEVLSRAESAGTLTPLSPGQADHQESLAAVEGRGGESGYEADAQRWREQITAELTGMKLSSHTEASETFGRLLALFEAARDESVALDPQAIKEDRRLQQDPLYHFKSPTATIALVSISEYYDLLDTILVALFEGINRAYQVVLGAVIGDLEAGKGSASLEPLKDALERMKSAVLTPGKSKGRLLVEVTRSLFAERGSLHLDYFLQSLVVPDAVFVRSKDEWFDPWPPPSKPEKKRSVAIDFYDIDQKTGVEKKLSLEFVLLRRGWQIGLLDKLYGENAALLSQLSSKTLRLHSNDDWREFLVLKLKELKGKAVSDEEALIGTIKLLERYLQAFTIHTPYNIYDSGRSKDNYLTREFPRALTGQSIHDCGVYALRIAYILSLIRRELKLQFRFLLLPNHIGLVITGEELPTFIVHNETVHRPNEQEVVKVREDWQSFPNPPGKVDETQFLGELGCLYFITGPLSMPFHFLKVPSDEKDLKAKLWASFKTYAAYELFGPASKKRDSGVFQFHLEYLRRLKEDISLHNEKIMPFWNVYARKVWAETERLLTDVLADFEAGRPGSVEAVRTTLSSYKDSLVRQYDKEIADRLAELRRAKERLHEIFEGYPGLKKKDVRSSYGPRIGLFDHGWAVYYRKHLDDVEKSITSPATLDQERKEISKLIQKIRQPFTDGDHPLHILLPLDF